MSDEEKKEKEGKKPLRSSTNKTKDLKKAYKKGTEREIPITDVADQEVEEKDVEAQTEEKPVSDSIIELEESINGIIAERDELKDKLLRNAAEMENLRRRTAKEKQEMLEYANERLLYRMLDLMDDMGNAIDVGNKTNDYDSLLKGIEMTKKNNLLTQT